MVKSGGGPERPTLVERILTATRLPTWAASLLLGTLVGPPGAVAMAAWATGSPRAGLERAFGGVAPADATGQLLSQASYWLMYVLGFWLTVHLRRAIVRAEGGLAPRLPGGSAEYHAIFSRATDLRPALAVGLAMAAASAEYVQGVFFPSHGAVWAAYHALRLALFFLMAGTVTWLAVAGLWGLHAFGGRELRLLPLAEDPRMGLKPAGRLALELARAYLLIVLVFALPALVGPVIESYPVVIAVLLLVGLALFFLPLYRLHERMVAVKDAHLRTIYAELVTIAESEPATPVATLSRVTALQAARREIAAGPGWPFDTAIVGRLSAVALPIALALVADLLKRLVLPPAAP